MAWFKLNVFLFSVQAFDFVTSARNWLKIRLLFEKLFELMFTEDQNNSFAHSLGLDPIYKFTDHVKFGKIKMDQNNSGE